MSKINYSSLDEVWGNSFNNNMNQNQFNVNNNNKINQNQNPNQNSNQNQNQNSNQIMNKNQNMNQNMNQNQNINQNQILNQNSNSNQNMNHNQNQNQNQSNYRNNTKLGNDFTGIQNNYINPAENINNGANQKQNFHKIDMNKVIDSMNLVERNKEPENTINDEYTKYRFNPVNTVAPLYTDDKNKYTPFQDNIEKKFLQDKIIELENDFRKYKLLLNSRNNNSTNSVDYFCIRFYF